jgi:4-amino-4-deoxy-L-arabinose transferase-like glycosyltransferase
MLQPTFSRLWREPQVVALILLVLGVYFSRLTALPIRGEESRWAGVSRELTVTGDLVVPRQQGQPFLSRPPLQCWLIALAGQARGQIDLAVVRLPATLATLLTSLLCYAYARGFLSPVGALAAGAGYATMVQVLELGRVAETEALLTLCLSASLLVWHMGHVRGWPAAGTWMAAYTLVALGVLAKGPQPPVYFAASVGLYLLLTRKLRVLLSWQHAVGVLTGALVAGAWLVPFYWHMGWGGLQTIFGHDVGLRFVDMSWGTIVKHFIGYSCSARRLGLSRCSASCRLPFVARLHRKPAGNKSRPKGVLAMAGRGRSG